MMVGLDIDGVLADFVTPFFSYVERKVGNGPIDPQSIIDLSFKQHPYLSEEALWKCLEEVSYDAAFWGALESLISPQDWRELDRLSRQDRLVFVTHRWERRTYSIHDVTRDWLRMHGVSRPVIHFTQEYKSALVRKLGIELFMDDRHENCSDVAENTTATVLMPSRTYNQAFAHPRVKRVGSFGELFEHVEGME
jgi:uncharacterized HAD superfamily protein